MDYYLINKKAAREASIYADGDTHRTTQAEVLVRENELDGQDADALSARLVTREEITQLLNKEELK
ncbi:hypothetical protein [Porphyromonas phage phage007a_Bg4]|uniref:Uncharacterized protein n=1 Tax=Porphyromonas phage phage012a_381OKJP TaxID=3154102 RepID=A0AAT9JBA8_9CAUD|nr:hypothetical protein [Porphyromonas gingivalis]MDH7902951.1 hypothetical protein [Porphyromonas gingivalis]RRG13547.1 hypothetical protein DOE52_06190 [Porphyromonas gingivalis]